MRLSSQLPYWLCRVCRSIILRSRIKTSIVDDTQFLIHYFILLLFRCAGILFALPLNQLVRTSLDAIGIPSPAVEWYRSARRLFSTMVASSSGAKSGTDQNQQQSMQMRMGILEKYRHAEAEALEAWDGWCGARMRVAPSASEHELARGIAKGLVSIGSLVTDEKNRFSRGTSASIENRDSTLRSGRSSTRLPPSIVVAPPSPHARSGGQLAAAGTVSAQQTSYAPLRRAMSTNPSVGPTRVSASSHLSFPQESTIAPSTIASLEEQRYAMPKASVPAVASAVPPVAPPPRRTAVAETAAILARLGESILDVRSAFDDASQRRDDLLDCSYNTLSRIMTKLEVDYTEGNHHEVIQAGLLPSMVSGTNARVTFSQFVRILGYVMDIHGLVRLKCAESDMANLNTEVDLLAHEQPVVKPARPTLGQWKKGHSIDPRKDITPGLSKNGRGLIKHAHGVGSSLSVSDAAVRAAFERFAVHVAQDGPAARGIERDSIPAALAAALSRSLTDGEISGLMEGIGHENGDFVDLETFAMCAEAIKATASHT